MTGELGADVLGALPLGYVGDTTLPTPDVPPPPPTIDGLKGLDLTGYNERGLVRVAGEVPNGTVTVQRSSAGVPTYTLRGGSNINITAEGFVLEDSEAPIGSKLTYTATSTPLNRVIQRNLVLTPDFNRGQQSWTPGANRTFSIVGGKGEIGSNNSGTGTASQVIGEVGLGVLEPSTTYLVTGKLTFSSPGIFTWLDVRNLGTWAAVKAAKTDWASVLSTEVILGNGVFTQVLLSLASGGATVGTTITALSVPINKTGEWFSFAAYITTPATIPNNMRLRIMHGSSLREKAISWQLDQFSMQSKAVTDLSYKLQWFSGDTVTPARPTDYMMSNQNWSAVTSDADIVWEGTPGNSVSRFIGPSRVSTSASITLEPPSIGSVCGPVLLSDPVSSSLGMWFGLNELDDLDYDANLTIMKVLNRADYIASSTARSGPRGSLTLSTMTLAERALALRLLQSGRVLYLRNSDVSYPENNWYIAIGDVTEVRMLPDARRPERLWSIPYTKVERPSGLIEASTGVTWKMIKDSKLTWAQLAAQREDWLDVLVTTP